LLDLHSAVVTLSWAPIKGLPADVSMEYSPLRLVLSYPHYSKRRGVLAEDLQHSFPTVKYCHTTADILCSKKQNKIKFLCRQGMRSPVEDVEVISPIAEMTFLSTRSDRLASGSP
jgi:hypothetical protein